MSGNEELLASRYGVKSKTNPKRNRILAFADTGMTQTDIAECVRVTHESVSRILKRNWETGSMDPGKSTGCPRVSTQ